MQEQFLYLKIRSVFLVILSLVGADSFAQNTTGITGMRDTSYSTYSAYINTLKTHPHIQIVPEFHSKNITEKKDIPYCVAGGRNLNLDAFYPRKKSRTLRPAILIIHGGGWRTGSRTQHYPLAQRLAGLGYACFTPEYRLSTEALYPAGPHDLKAAFRWVRAHAKEYQVDTNKIVALGFSAGGELAAFIGTTSGMPQYEGDSCNTEHTSTVQAVVDIDGTLSFTNSESHEGDDSRSISAATNWFGYPRKDNIDLWNDASPLTHVSATTPPTLFLNSAVPWMHAGREDYIAVLNKHHIYLEVHTFEGAPHSFCLFYPWFEPTIKYIDHFLTKIFKR